VQLNESLSREPNSRPRAYQQTPLIVRRIEYSGDVEPLFDLIIRKEGQDGVARDASTECLIPRKCQKPSAVNQTHES
jgi:hypothetical protein